MPFFLSSPRSCSNGTRACGTPFTPWRQGARPPPLRRGGRPPGLSDAKLAHAAEFSFAFPPDLRAVQASACPRAPGSHGGAARASAPLSTSPPSWHRCRPRGACCGRASPGPYPFSPPVEEPATAPPVVARRPQPRRPSSERPRGAHDCAGRRHTLVRESTTDRKGLAAASPRLTEVLRRCWPAPRRRPSLSVRAASAGADIPHHH